MIRKLLLLILAFAAAFSANAQIDIQLYEQFNGRYDFTFCGNTLNPSENNTTENCTIFTQSSATLNLQPNDAIIAAYLYWAGSGAGDFDILLNGTAVTPDRTFPLSAVNTDGLTRQYFSAFKDVTAQVQATGNGVYTVSEFDLTAVVATSIYCGIKTNFGGWAIIIVYENDGLPLNQLNLYDGMQYVPAAINITLPSLNVVDNVGAKIGFLAWEGDKALATESLSINGNILSSLPLNPALNAFNGTNSVTVSDQLHNMDLDVYNIQDNIQIGDETADISLTSSQDFVMVNAVLTKLNSQLPDATVTVDDITLSCNSRVIEVDYTVYNVNSTDVLPAGTPVSIYINGDFIDLVLTTADLPIGGSESGSILLTVPNNVPLDFELLFVADDAGDGTGGIRTETDETNNTFMQMVTLWASPPLADPADITGCDIGDGTAFFDFSGYEESLKNSPTDVVRFYTSLFNAQDDVDFITETAVFPSGGQEIFVRLQDENGCFTIGSFLLEVEDCDFPDATVTIGTITKVCNSRTIEVQYRVANLLGNDILPANTPVAVFANNILVTTFVTQNDIPIGGNETGTISIIIPNTIPANFQLLFYVDNSGNGTGIIEEINEQNNTFVVSVSLIVSPPLQEAADITSCDIGNGTGIFDFSGYLESLKNEPADTVSFHTSLADAENDEMPITNNAGYPSLANGQEIFVRLENEDGCYIIGSFLLLLEDCLFPDATIVINSAAIQCNSRVVAINYTVNNFDGFDILPAGTPVAIYINNIYLTGIFTQQDIAIGGTESGTISITVPMAVPADFTLTMAADDSGTTIGIVEETNETNNTFSIPVGLTVSPVLQEPQDITSCDTGKGTGIFDFSGYETSLQTSPTDEVTFYISLAQAQEGINFITQTAAYASTSNPQEIFVRLENEDGCYSIASFLLIAEDCMFPDATIVMGTMQTTCNSRIIIVDYTVNNFNSFDILPAGTPVSIYVDGEFLEYTETLNNIPVGGSESSSISLTIPDDVPLLFSLTFVADDIGDGTGIVVELDETNNSATDTYSLIVSPELQQAPDVISCNLGFGAGTFDFSNYEDTLKNSPTDVVTFHLSQADADQGINPISNTTDFTSTSNPQQLFIRLDNGTCQATGSFLLRTRICPPTTYNYVTPNNDGVNDTFFVTGLRNIFLNFKMSIYNRWGSLVWTGDHSKPDWDGIASEEKVGSKDTTVPIGTYYFVLELNEPDYPEPIVGWVYVTK